MMDVERMAKNEALFRDVNERIAESAQRFDSDEAEFVCECADAACAERIPTELDVYEGVRSDGAQFLVKPGHEDERFERVVAQRAKFRIVEKLNAAGSIARRLDPRAA